MRMDTCGYENGYKWISERAGFFGNIGTDARFFGKKDKKPDFCGNDNICKQLTYPADSCIIHRYGRQIRKRLYRRKKATLLLTVRYD